MSDNTIIKKKAGFQGQKAVVIPRTVLSEKCAHNEIISTLYITDIGYYPKAKYHFIERPDGTDEHILIFCQEGAGRVTINGSVYRIGAGDLVAIPVKVPHKYEADEQSPWTIYWVHFKGSTSGPIISLLRKRTDSYKSFIQSSEHVISLFDEMYHQLERGYGTDNLIYANMCLWHFLSKMIFNDKAPTLGRPNHKDAADRAIDFLSKKIDQVLNLEEIAREVNLSPSHFSYLFKKKTGFSPIEYFNHLKVQRACRYLIFTNLRIKEIAQELGIDDPYYFSRMFTKIMGMAPNEYREKKNS